MYPRLTFALREMFADNGMLVKPEREWRWPENVDELETLACEMTDFELIEISQGERAAAEAIIRRYGAHDLDDFLNSVFDGEDSKYFCD